ncbi:MAG: response regulator [Candidatus Auribacterota bacterium]|nr:response regulator [Candidatus Auribacterota bacterium]
MKYEKKNPLILIVEDDIRTAEMLRLGLSARGFDSVVAYDGYEALLCIEKQIPDVVLLDLCLPGGMDGLDLCRRIKTEYTNTFIPVIFLTAMDDVKSKVDGLDAGADDYITKPYDFLEVIARLKSMLRIKQLQDELVIKNKNLEELNALKDDFLSVCSHDLRNIVMPITEASALIRDNVIPHSTGKFADIIHRQSKKMVHLLNTLLTSLKSDRGDLVLSLENVDVIKYLEQYVDDCVLVQNIQDVEVNLEIKKRFRRWKFDPAKIDEVLTNLVSNAQKFVPAGGKITLLLDGFRKGGVDYMVMGVKDTGEGIPEDKLQHIFDKYVTSNSGKRGIDMGLGLAICKSIVEKHGGFIWAESVVGIGSTFYFALPEVKTAVSADERISGSIPGVIYEKYN